jgi:hypothetical protein
VSAQRRDDVGDGLAGKALVDPTPLRDKLTGRRRDGVAIERGFGAVVDDRPGEVVKRRVGHVVVGKADGDRPRRTVRR